MIFLLAISLSITSVLMMMNIGYYTNVKDLTRVFLSLSWIPATTVGIIMASNVILITSLVFCLIIQVLLIIERVTA